MNREEADEWRRVYAMNMWERFNLLSASHFFRTRMNFLGCWRQEWTSQVSEDENELWKWNSQASENESELQEWTTQVSKDESELPNN